MPVIEDQDRVKLIWLLVRMLAYVPRLDELDDLPEDKRKSIEWHPKMVEAITREAKEQIDRLSLLGTAMEVD